jgi:hypothetical protein
MIAKNKLKIFKKINYYKSEIKMTVKLEIDLSQKD